MNRFSQFLSRNVKRLLLFFHISDSKRRVFGFGTESSQQTSLWQLWSVIKILSGQVGHVFEDMNVGLTATNESTGSQTDRYVCEHNAPDSV